ncbi:farnesyl diphosphate synthase [Melampsora americana]|nr:farnesyl diphosphate synthase [Melampsora americana]
MINTTSSNEKPIVPSFPVTPPPTDLTQRFPASRAACVIIGDEILNGKTLDTNSHHLAGLLFWSGISLDKIEIVATNDAFMLEGAIYIILKSFFRNLTSYVNLLELLHDVAFQTEPQQVLIRKASFRTLQNFVLFFLSTCCSGHANVWDDSPTDPGQIKYHESQSKTDSYRQAMEILLPLGVYLQIQDDYLDCFGGPNVIGKVGTDIVDNKCSWNINTALKHCTADQRKVMDENYGRKNPESEKKVKEIFSAENIDLLFS